MTKSNARLVAKNITKYLNRKGDSTIIMIVKTSEGWEPEVSQEILAIWPNIADLITEY